AIAPAPVLDAPPGSHRPSGALCEYTTPSGSANGCAVTPLSTSVVPSTEFQMPSASAPAPSCAAHPSVQPAITAVPSGSPVRAAASAHTVPIGVPGRTSGGSRVPGTASASRTSVGQHSLTRSAPVLSAL